MCSWCQKCGLKLFTLKTSSGHKTFCSELCFTQCRRASFKKNKVCDWCKHIRHTVNYVDFKDGEQQLEFCSEKCLNQYKMNIFCRETQEHLQQIQSKLKGNTPIPVKDQQIMITPELWLQQDRIKYSKAKRSMSETRGKTRSVDRKLDYQNMNSQLLKALKSPNPSVDRISVENSLKDKLIDKTSHQSIITKESPAISSSSLSPRSSSRNSADSYSLGGRSLPLWMPPNPLLHPMMYAGLLMPHHVPDAPAELRPHDPRSRSPVSAAAGVEPTMLSSARLHEPHSPTMEPLHFPGPRLPMAWPRGLPPMPLPFQIPNADPVLFPSFPVPPGLSTSGVPPVTIMIPFPVVLPVPIPIPIPILLSMDSSKKPTTEKSSSSDDQPPNSPISSSDAPQDDDSHSEDSKPYSICKAPKVSICRGSRPDSIASNRCARMTVASSRCESQCSLMENLSLKRHMVNDDTLQLNATKQARFDSPVSSPEYDSVVIDLSMDTAAATKSCNKEKNVHVENRIKDEPSPKLQNSADDMVPRDYTIKVPKIHIVTPKPEPPLSQQLPLAPTDHAYSLRRGLILDAPAVLNSPKSPSPERRVYLRTTSSDMMEVRRRCLRTRIRTK